MNFVHPLRSPRRGAEAPAVRDAARRKSQPGPGWFWIYCSFGSGFTGSGTSSVFGGESGKNDLAGSLTLPESIYAPYNELLKYGWRVKEIDEMNILGFLCLRAWGAVREQDKKAPAAFH